MGGRRTMKEFFRRLFARPGIATELLMGTLFINLLALAQPLFTMQVLNRYVAHGVDATLVTLTTGALIAIAMEFAFRQARLRVARGVSAKPDKALAVEGFEALTRAKAPALDQMPPEVRREVVGGASTIESTYNASNICSILDVPFSLTFVLIIYLLKPPLALVVATFLVVVFVIGIVTSLSMQGTTNDVQQASAVGSGLLSTATREGDTVRAFNAAGFLAEAWRKHVGQIQTLRRDLTLRQALVQSVTQSASGLLSIAVVALGGIYVVLGQLDVGSMIGINILAARALQPISRFSQLGAQLAKARQAIDTFEKLAKVPREATSGSALRSYSGRIEFRDLAFAFPGNASPLFESLSLKLEAGQVLVVTGGNGTGKTTLARLIMGLLDPIRGQILVDGLDLRQVAPEWWRRQVIFLPQEPALLNATVEENLRVNNPDIETSTLNRIIDACGLRRFLDESAKGFETPVVDNGWRLSEGIRRRLALARALATDGQLVLIDEPTEGLDVEGCNAMRQILGALAQRGKTVIITSHGGDVIKGRHTILDLNVKPIPELGESDSRAVPAASEAVAAGRPPLVGGVQLVG